MVYVCDEYLYIPNLTTTNIKRFFKITSRLPQELQMLISNIKYHISSDLIPILERRKAFKDMC